MACQDDITVSIGHLSPINMGCTPANNDGQRDKYNNDGLQNHSHSYIFPSPVSKAAMQRYKCKKCFIEFVYFFSISMSNKVEYKQNQSKNIACTNIYTIALTMFPWNLATSWYVYWNEVNIKLIWVAPSDSTANKQTLLTSSMHTASQKRQHMRNKKQPTA